MARYAAASSTVSRAGARVGRGFGTVGFLRGFPRRARRSEGLQRNRANRAAAVRSCVVLGPASSPHARPQLRPLPAYEHLADGARVARVDAVDVEQIYQMGAPGR